MNMKENMNIKNINEGFIENEKKGSSHDGGGDRSPLIVAMKGHPGTGKSTLARSIAAHFRCPLLDKDDIRDATLPVEKRLNHVDSDAFSSSNISNSNSSNNNNNNNNNNSNIYSSVVLLLNDLSYESLFNLIATQIRIGLSLVVVDSTLSRRAHLDRLLQIARVVVVECRPRDEREWRRRLVRRGQITGSSNWHKPSTWQDIESLLERYGGSTDFEITVPKIVVDTTATSTSTSTSTNDHHLLSSVIRFIESHILQ